MSKDKKIRLKEMSHKKLRKLCKKLGKELQQATSDLKYVSSKYEANRLMVEKWKQQFDAEVYYKKQIQEKASKLSVELTKAEDEIGELKRYAKSLEKTLASEARRIKGYEELNKYQKADILRLQEAVETGNLALHVVNQASDNTPFIGELPEDVGMGVDGQLRPYREMSDAEHQAWVAKEVARAMQENYDNVHEEQVEGNCIGHTKSAEVEEEGHVPFDEPTNGVGPAKPTGVVESDNQRVDMVGSLFGVPQADGYIPKSADVDEAVDWAKRNGHHQPEGNPEPNKMDTVKIKTADEISAENIDKHTEMVCNDIAQDKSRLL